MNRPMMMSRLLTLLLLLWIADVADCLASEWSLPPTMPPGVQIRESVEVDEAQRAAIGSKLGGRIRALTNAALAVHGRPVQVNVLTARDEASAETIYATLSALHSGPYCVRRGLTVVEFTGRGVDEALATKTSYEIGLRDKPHRVVYQVSTQLATLDDLEYGSAQALTDALNAETVDSAQLTALSEHVTPGATLALRDPTLDQPPAVYEFAPSPSKFLDRGDFIEYRFAAPEIVHGIPFVDCSLRLTVDDSPVTSGDVDKPGARTRPTRRWPSDAPDWIARAQQIAGNHDDRHDAIAAILRWLTPGTNLDYAGPVGSRWGVEAVLDQGYGRCWDFSDCFVTLARALEIPARQVAGWLYGSGGHVWAEYYAEDEGWIQVDPTGGDVLPCGIYHIPFFTSDDGEMPIVYVTIPTVRIVETN